MTIINNFCGQKSSIYKTITRSQNFIENQVQSPTNTCHYCIMNEFILKHIKTFEMIGVIMRIISFSLVSWLGPDSPFLFVWIFNTIDAILLSWCAILKKDKAYTILNLFWILVGVVGILRVCGLLH